MPTPGLENQQPEGGTCEHRVAQSKHVEGEEQKSKKSSIQEKGIIRRAIDGHGEWLETERTGRAARFFSLQKTRVAV